MTAATASTLCPRCLSENRIATASGPTCPHQEPNGAAWFPSWYMSQAPGESTESRRLAWIQEQQSQQNIQ